MASALTCFPLSHNPTCRTPSPTPSSAHPKPSPFRFLGSSNGFRSTSSPGCSSSRTAIPASINALWNQPNKADTPVELEAIANEAQFDSVLSAAQHQSKPIIVDWMATWCRKCIYLKPKLEKLAAEFESDVKFYYVDVNVVPQAMVKRAEVTKMPTIQLWKNGERCDEVIGGHKAWLVIEEVRDMLQKHLK